MRRPERNSSAAVLEIPGNMRQSMSLIFQPTSVSGIAESYFVGAWSPDSILNVALAPEDRRRLNICSGANWWLAGTIATMSNKKSLANRCPDDNTAIGFKGYIVQPDTIHSYVPAYRIVNYWRAHHSSSRHNGVFSMAVIDVRKQTLTLITDALGLSPLYYRRSGSVVLFATNPRLLTMDGDSPDLLSWKSLISRGIVPGDKTLSAGVQRVPAGHSIVASTRSLDIKAWFNFAELPKGSQTLDRKSLGDIEKAFQVAMDRCLSLSGFSTELPLSSGHDSRRILSFLLHRNVGFHSSTVRVRQKGFRDLDAPIASEISRKYSFPHRIVEIENAGEFAELDGQRQLLMDNETSMHTWAVKYMASLPDTPVMILDGILGDILGNPGFRMSGMYASVESDLTLIMAQLIEPGFNTYVKKGRWPNDAALDNYLRSQMDPFTDRVNMAELAFLLFRQRRMTALWSLQSIPAGHLVVCPYADLNYVELMLSFRPQDKHKTIVQQACLKEFWPDLAAFPGNRMIPESIRPGHPNLETKWDLACLRALDSDFESAANHAHSLLAVKGQVLLKLAKLSDSMALRSLWFIQPFAELTIRQYVRRPAWTLAH